MLVSVFVLCTFVLSGTSAQAQDSPSDVHVLPWVVAGNGWESTLMIRSNQSSSVPGSHTVRCDFDGPIAEGGLIPPTVNVDPNKSMFIDVTDPSSVAGVGDYVSSYVGLACTGDVYAQASYRLVVGGKTTGEATVFSSGSGIFLFGHLYIDLDVGDWFGLAIANVFGRDPVQQYQLTLYDEEGNPGPMPQVGDMVAPGILSVPAQTVQAVLWSATEPVRGTLKVETTYCAQDAAGPCPADRWRADLSSDEFGIIGIHGAGTNADGILFSTVPVMD